MLLVAHLVTIGRRPRAHGACLVNVWRIDVVQGLWSIVLLHAQERIAVFHHHALLPQVGQALRDDPPDTRWVAVSAAADSADIATAAAFRDELGVGGLIATLALAVPAAALGWKSVAGLRSLR